MEILIGALTLLFASAIAGLYTVVLSIKFGAKYEMEKMKLQIAQDLRQDLLALNQKIDDMKADNAYEKAAEQAATNYMSDLSATIGGGYRR